MFTWTACFIKIYNDDYEIIPKRDKKQQEFHKKLFAERDKMEELLGFDFVDHLLALEANRADLQNFHYYKEGFRLGVRLMLDALTPA